MNRPPRVADRYLYATEPPPELSARCRDWIDRIRAGWRPNRRVRVMGYDEKTEHFGVYVWEWINVLSPMLGELEQADRAAGSATARDERGGDE